MPEGVGEVAPVAVLQNPVAATLSGEVDAMMSFNDFSKWMEMQKRLAKMVPPVKVDIRSISKGGASFTMKFQGNVDVLKRAMADNGIALGAAAVVVDTSVLTGGPPVAARPVYDLQLVD